MTGTFSLPHRKSVFSPALLAEVAIDGSHKRKLVAEGDLKGFTITEEGKPLAKERQIRWNQWTLETVYDTPQSNRPYVSRRFFGGYKWGENGNKLNLFWNGRLRVFACDEFEVTHRDYQNSLRICSRGDCASFLQGAWACFWVWGRIAQENEGG